MDSALLRSETKQFVKREKIAGQHSFYAILNENELYFAGFNAGKGTADFVTDALEAKLFTNKYEIKLRPNERLVEIVSTLNHSNSVVSLPFHPGIRKNKTDVKVTE